ncbi:MAG: hemolysin family protein [Chloroflexi bacterium]|nr:hemolysin family protein [Chloroflexota bacterium]MDA1240188.1 hemolysin family protein [Chloroflexota bacterium]
MLTYIVLFVVLLLLSAFFSSSETAFLTLQRVRLAHMVQENIPGAARVALLVDRPRRLLSAILLGNNLVNTAAAAVGTAFVADVVTGGGLGVVISTLAVTILLLVFGEIGPKSIALSHSFALSRLWSLPMVLWVRMTTPITVALDAGSDGLLRMLGGDDHPSTLSPAELRTAIRMGAAAGSIESSGASHLLGALTLQQRQVQEIMVPRLDIVSVSADASLSEAAALLAHAGYLRVAVYERIPEEIVGFVHVSDVNAWRVEGHADRPVREAMRVAHFESEHASIARVLDVMQEHATYLVMLVDEFGVTSGLVTLEDILEEVVGELRSESGFEAIEEPITGDGVRIIEGSTQLAELSDDLGVSFSDVDGNTVAGLILHYLRHFPERGEYADHGGFRFTVLDADDRRITSVSIERTPEPEEDE